MVSITGPSVVCIFLVTLAVSSSPNGPADFIKCDFSRDTCYWVNSYQDELQWNNYNGGRVGASEDRGPHVQADWFAYVDTPPFSAGRTARLASDWLQTNADTGYCFRFMYYIYNPEGQTKLEILIKPFQTDAGQNDQVIWSDSHDTRNRWRQGHVYVSHTVNFRLVVVGTTGGNSRDLAISRFDLVEGDCFEVVEGDVLYQDRAARLSSLESRLVGGKYGLAEGPLFAAMSANEYLWPGGIIPYQIDPKFSNSEMATLKRALQDYMNNTCLQFVERTTEDNWIYMQKVADALCSSSAGRQMGRQLVRLNSGCFWRYGTIVHELMHAIGFWHEQNRPDRDEHIQIIWDNIQWYAKENFKRLADDYATTLETPYDYDSVMHYGKNDFAKSRDLITIKPLREEAHIGQRERLSQIDLLEINRLYNCPNAYSTKQPDSVMVHATTPEPRPARPTPVERQTVTSWRQEFANNRRTQEPPVQPRVTPSSANVISTTADRRFNQFFLKLSGPGRCDFENSDLCGWSQSEKDDFDWQIHSGKTPSHFTGPSTDHTTRKPAGFFVYIEASSPRVKNDMARLVSKQLESTTVNCLTFYYSMHGADVGKLTVKLLTHNQGREELVLWEKSAEQSGDNEWLVGQVPLSSTASSFMVLIEAMVGEGFRGDIALDDVELMLTDSCPFLPELVEEESCDFESNTFCEWDNVEEGDQFNWQLNRGGTPSYSTGPQFDHTKLSPQGSYVYTEASTPRTIGDKARLSRRLVRTNANYCLRFWYHMYGAHVGSLRTIFQTPEGQEHVLWKKDGAQGNKWKEAFVNIQTPVMVSHVILEASIGDGFQGDIAVDDVQLKSGLCSYNFQSIDCDFFSGTCEWKMEGDASWQHHSTQDQSPPRPEGLPDKQFAYLLGGSTTTTKPWSRASLVSPDVATGKWCLSFYHRVSGWYDNEPDELLVIKRDADRSETIVQKIAGTTGTTSSNGWHEEHITFDSQNTFKIVFESQLKQSTLVGITAIDQLKLKAGPCR